MCGIVGVLSLRDKTISRQELEKSLDLISYRGPDASGVFEDEKIILGHRRLSIIDLLGNANQPMKLKCKKFNKDLVIVFNGEIYNYVILAVQLKKLGHTFSSNSDTEIILHSFEEWGSDCFKKFRGMFAFAIWDSEKQELILARDRFGIKPLYYYQDNDYFIFASEIKAILNFQNVKKKINHSAVHLFLQQGWISQPQTFYENIFALESGSFMIVKNGEITKDAFTDIQNDFLQEKEKISLGDAVKKVKTALLGSVSAHLVSDVEVGAFLSGGVDSSVLVALMRELGQEKITTVSAVFPGTIYNEAGKIKLVSEKFKTNHIDVKISGQDFVENLDNIFEHIDQPTVDGVNTYFVSLAAKKAGLKVVLSGLGGDELFYGYPSFTDIPKLLKLSPFLKSLLGKMMLKDFFATDNFNQKIAKLLQVSNSGEGMKMLKSRKTYFSAFQRQKRFTVFDIYLSYRGLFSDEQIQLLEARGEKWDVGSDKLEIENKKEKIDDVLSLISYLEFSNYMKNQLLRDSDVFSMAHSIELRTPFVDDVLLKTITRIPSEYKIKNGVKKFLLKEAFKNQLPDEILKQKKQGFVLPIDLWLKNEAKDLIKNELLSSEIFERQTIKLLLNKFYGNKLHWSRIWSLFVLNRFVKKI
ncbi:MAG: asparagine synthase (glutamine-hydrolyzing) [Patescibacteria group bacterium]